MQKEGGALDFIPLIGKENHPIVEVTWLEAHAYSQSDDWRLPSEAESEKAAVVNLFKSILLRNESL